MGFFSKLKEKQEEKERITKELAEIQMHGVYKIKKGEEPSTVLKCFFEEHPTAKNVYDALCDYETSEWNPWTEDACAQLMANGATFVLANKYAPTAIVTREMALLWYDNMKTGFIIPAPAHNTFYDMSYVRQHKNMIPYYTEEKPKEKSIIVNAMVGSIVAGPAGAVVGAIHAASKNANATSTVKVNYLPAPSDVVSTSEEFINPYKLRSSEARTTLPDEKYSIYSISIDRCAIFGLPELMREFEALSTLGKLEKAAKWSWGVESDDDIKSKYPEWGEAREKVAETLAEGIMHFIMVKRGKIYTSMLVQKEFENMGFLFHEGLIKNAMWKLDEEGKITYVPDSSCWESCYKLV